MNCNTIRLIETKPAHSTASQVTARSHYRAIKIIARCRFLRNFLSPLSFHIIPFG